MTLPEFNRALLWFAGCWPLVAGLFAVALLLSLLFQGSTGFISRLQAWAQGLLVPAGLLLSRLVLLYLPVPGAAATHDRVLFWSASAFFHYQALLALVFGLLAWRAFFGPWSGVSRWRAAITAAVAGLALWAFSAALLPLRGALDTQVAAAVSPVVLLKLVLVHPLLLPGALVGLALVLLLPLLGAARVAPQLGRLLLVLVLAAGALQAPFTFKQGLQPTLGPLERAASKEYFAAWLRTLPQTDTTRTNIAADGALDSDVVHKVRQQALVRPWWIQREVSLPVYLLGPLTLLLLLLGLRLRSSLEHVRFKPAHGAAAPAQPPGAPLQEVTLAETPSLAPALKWRLLQRRSQQLVSGGAGLALGLLALVVANNIYEGSDLLLGASTVARLALVALGLALGWLASQALASLADRRRELAVHAWYCRDMVARSFLPRWLQGPAQQLPQEFSQQPASILLPLAQGVAAEGDQPVARAAMAALVARDNSPHEDQAGPLAALTAHPCSTNRQRVDALARDDHASELVARTDSALPRVLWPHAVRQLMASSSGEVQRVVLNYQHHQRGWLMQRCRDSAQAEVRVAALAALGPLTSSEAHTLARSKHGDMRREALGTGLVHRATALERAASHLRLKSWLRRRRLLGLCLNDPSPAVRAMAQQLFLLKQEITLVERLRSRQPEVRLQCLRDQDLTQAQIHSLCRKDSDARVREAAFCELYGSLLPGSGGASSDSASDQDNDQELALRQQAAALFSCRWPEIKVLVMRAGCLLRDQLVQAYQVEPAQSVRTEAWRLLQREGQLSRADAAQLARSKFADVRITALRSRRLERQPALKLCLKDSEADVRAAAWELLGRKLEQDEADQLARSRRPDNRQRAVESGLLSDERLNTLASDPNKEVKAAAGSRKLKTALTGKGDLSSDYAKLLSTLTNQSVGTGELLKQAKLLRRLSSNKADKKGGPGS